MLWSPRCIRWARTGQRSSGSPSRAPRGWRGTARDAGVAPFVHVSTCAVYDRSPGGGDVDETSELVGDDADVYAVTKRDTDAALGGMGIVGLGETSAWNTLRSVEIRDDEEQRRTNPVRSLAWVHVDDLAALVADVAVGHVPDGDDASTGPVLGGCTAVDVAGEPAAALDYVGTVTRALGLEPVWDHDLPAWTGQIVRDRARGWGWAPAVTRDDALAELAGGLGEPARTGA